MHKILETDDQLLVVNEDHRRHCDFAQLTGTRDLSEEAVIPQSEPNNLDSSTLRDKAGAIP